MLTPYEGDPQYHKAAFERWVSSGERDDYAAVLFDPPLQPSDTGAAHPIHHAVLAPRHEGVNLREERQSWPVHVYVLTAPSELAHSEAVPPDAFKIEFWGLLAADE